MLFESIMQAMGNNPSPDDHKSAPAANHEPPADILRTVLDHIGQGVAVFGPDLRLILCNLRYADLFGYPEHLVQVGARYEDVVRHNVAQAHPNMPIEEVDALVQRRVALAREGNARRIERVLADGRVISIRRSPLPHGGFIATYLDITDKKRAQERADAYVQMLSEAIEHMSDGIRIFDKDLRLVASNSRAFETFDDMPEAGKSGASFETHLAHAGTCSDSVEIASTDGIEHVREIDYNGRFIVKRRTPMPNGGFVTTYTDVTEIRRAQLMLADEFKRAELVNRSKSEFLANMSHELRTPLNAIIGFSEIISDQIFGPIGNVRYVEYVKDILDSSRHLLGIINDILDLSKIEAGRTQLQESMIDVGFLVKSCLRLMAQSPIRGDVALNDEIPQGLPLINGDERMLKQLLLNLVSNAVKFTPDGGAVSVSASADDKGMTISVSDNGIGIAEEDIAKALTPFQQIESSLARKYEGTGLGLPLAASFAKMHGGELTLDSTLGVGTRVSVFIPTDRLIPRTDQPHSAAVA